ncbi:MAG TPA: Ig domain-containing protein, partial [Nitrospirota bacterium]
SYTWAVTSGSLPPGFSILGGNSVQCGSPANVGTYNFTLQVTDGASNTASQAFTLRINPAPVGLTISTGSPLNNAAVGAYYFIYIETVPGSGTSPFSWSLTSGSLPPGLTLGGGTNYYTSISGTPTGTQTTDVTYSFTITVHDGIGRTNSKDFSLIVSPPPRKIRTSGNLNVKICAGDYANNCTINENTSPLKSGLIDEFWSKARFGVMDFNKSQNIHAVPNIANCIEQNPGATPDPNFLSGVENAVAIDPITTLVNGEYEAVNYFATESSPNCNPYTNATTCTKNFILMLTAGVGADNPTNPDTGLSAEMFSSGVPASCTAATLSNLAKNACYGYNHPDLRADVSGRQYVGTYIVNTMGTPPSNGYTADDAPVTSGDRLKQAAVKGGGTYYGVTDPATLKSRLEQALQDIIKRAAAGTAASVLASGQGSGANLIQAVFYPRRKFGDTEIAWTGRLTNFWYYVDPFFSNSTIREDDGNKVLNLKTDNTNHDYITSLYFSGEATMAKRWPDANGDGVVDGSALIPDIEFEKL